MNVCEADNMRWLQIIEKTRLVGRGKKSSLIDQRADTIRFFSD